MLKEGWFGRLCSSLDTQGGHILCGFALILLGGLGVKALIPKAEDLIIAGLAVITMAAKGQNGRGSGDRGEGKVGVGVPREPGD